MIKKGVKQLIAEAEKRSKGISVEEAKKRVGDANTVFVDIRDVRELDRGAFHAPRGMGPRAAKKK
jgi:predicted sulfurtransferase